MGACVARKHPKQTNQRSQTQNLESNTENPLPNQNPQQFQKAPTLIVQPTNQVNQSIKITEEQKPLKVEEVPVIDDDLYKDDACVRNIHKSFEEINQIFLKMTQEFDKLADYFLKGTDYEPLK